MNRSVYAVMIALLISGSALAQDAETVNPVLLQPSGDDAAVYFYRSNLFGGAIKFWAFVDEIPIGMLRGRQYTGAIVPSGEHTVWARSGNVSALRVNLHPGETYYFRIGARLGAIKGRVNLEQETAAVALEDIEGLTFRQLTEEGREQAADIVTREYSEAVQKAN